MADQTSINKSVSSISVKKVPCKIASITNEVKHTSQRRLLNFRGLSKRLIGRKKLFRNRRWIVNLEFLLAMAGIILTVLYIESYYMAGYIRFAMEIIITLTTLMLIVSVVLYHWTGINIYMLDNDMENWRLAITWSKVSTIIIEIFVCAIQPVPKFKSIMTGTNATHIERTMSQWDKEHDHNREVPMNIILSLVMLCRLYLIGRLAVVHSSSLIDTSIQSYGALCKVKINAQFIFRALMSTHPCWVLAIILFITFICTSWAMHICETFSFAEDDDGSPMQTMWLIAITFLTVGYGDITPVSTCGRVISVITGLAGVGIVALMVAVLSNKLELTRAEKCIYSFIRRMRLETVHRNAAANVIKEAMKIYKLRKKGNSEVDSQIIRHRRKFLVAVRLMRESSAMNLEIKQSELQLVDLHQSLSDINEITKQNTVFQNDIRQRVASIEKCLYELNKCIRNLNHNQ